MVYNESDAKQIIVASTLVIVGIRNNKIFHVNFFSPQTPNSTKCNNRSCTQHFCSNQICSILGSTGTITHRVIRISAMPGNKDKIV